MTTTGWITFLLQEPKALEMLDVVWFKNHLYVAGGEGPPVSRWVFLWEIPNLLGGTPHCPLKMEKLPDFFFGGGSFLRVLPWTCSTGKMKKTLTRMSWGSSPARFNSLPSQDFCWGFRETCDHPNDGFNHYHLTLTFPKTLWISCVKAKFQVCRAQNHPTSSSSKKKT